MYKILSLLTFNILILFTFTGQTHAETVLFFAPTRVDIDSSKPVQEIRVTNMSNIARAYTLSLHNLVMNENGQTARVDTFDYSAKRMVRFVPHQIDIKPGERQIIRIQARFPEGTEDGQYHAHLEFLENVSKRVELNKDIVGKENQAKMNAQISYATAVPVVLTKGEIKTDVSMSDVKLGQDEKSGQPSVSMVLGRSGNGQGNIFLEADYIAPDGTEKKAAVRRSIYVYRELSKRNHAFILELIDEADMQKGGKIRVKLYNKDVSETEPVDTILLTISN
jgi:hypothetical protein